MANERTIVTVSAQAAGGNDPVVIKVQVTLSDEDKRLAPDFSGIVLWEMSPGSNCNPLDGAEWKDGDDEEATEIVATTRASASLSFQVSRAEFDQAMRSLHFKSGEESNYLQLWVDDFAAAIRKAREIPLISAVRSVQI